MPGLLDETELILRYVAKELGPDTYVDLMARYHPAGLVGKEGATRTRRSTAICAVTSTSARRSWPSCSVCDDSTGEASPRACPSARRDPSSGGCRGWHRSWSSSTGSSTTSCLYSDGSEASCDNWICG